MSLAINVENLGYSYNLQKKSKHGSANPNNLVLSIKSWQVGAGEKIFLYGDSGSGKTTLLNLLCGILVPSTGKVSLFDQDLSELSNNKRDKYRAKNIGVVFQKFNLIPYLSVMKNVQLAAHFAKQKSDNINRRVSVLLNALKLPADIINKQVNQLSVGQQQRIAIVRALINQPKLLLVDEPTSALDASARDAFMRVLMDTCEQLNTSLIFVSHDASLGSYFDSKVNLTSLNLAAKNHSAEPLDLPNQDVAEVKP